MKIKKMIASALMIATAMASMLSVTACSQEIAQTSIRSVTWQDPENAVVIWNSDDGSSYNVYRSSSVEDGYELIGTSDSGSFRDSEAEYPNEYYYKIQPAGLEGSEQLMSEPVAPGTNPQPLSKVTVLMYHNFISDEDIANGVEFEEYSLKPEDFEEDLKYFRNNGYTTITSADLIDYINGEKPLPLKAVIISIDDGTEGVYKNAWPLLKKYNSKADFNLIGENIDNSWQMVHDGGTRLGESAPYCVWEEIYDLVESGDFNICSHTYGMHKYDTDGRIGASMMDGESEESYIQAIKADYDLAVSCITGWTSVDPKTMAYPYSKRSSESDRLILENTGYEILMAGDGARPTVSNYFVDGVSADSYERLMNRPCRMDGHPASEYLQRADETDSQNGVNYLEDTAALTSAKSGEIAGAYQVFDDVTADKWYAGSVYYNYVNSLIPWAESENFQPDALLTHAEAAGVLYRLAGEPAVGKYNAIEGLTSASPYYNAVNWAVNSGILSAGSALNEAVSREEMAFMLYKYADGDAAGDNGAVITDISDVSPYAVEAVKWVCDNGIFSLSEGAFLPDGRITRAQMAALAQNMLYKTAE